MMKSKKCIYCLKRRQILPGWKICDECNHFIGSMTGRDRSREIIRIRKKHTCQKCNKKWKEGKRRFDIHHAGDLCGKMSRGYDAVETKNGLKLYCHSCHMNLHSVRKKMSKGHKKVV